MAVDTLTVFAVFMTQLKAETPSCDGGTRIPDRQSEPDEWDARNLAERTKLIQESFVTACSKIGQDTLQS